MNEKESPATEAFLDQRHGLRRKKPLPPQVGGEVQGQAAETVGSTDWLDVLYGRTYVYDDLLAAYITGRAHERKYGDRNGDQGDFITWLKRRIASSLSARGGRERAAVMAAAIQLVRVYDAQREAPDLNDSDPGDAFWKRFNSFCKLVRPSDLVEKGKHNHT